MSIRWLTAFLDLPARSHPAGVAFWSAVTATRASTTRGDRGQFSTAIPADGAAYLRYQDVGSDGPQVHLDLHVDDVDAAADRAVALGAVDQPTPSEVRIQRSPGGLIYCFVTAEDDAEDAGVRPPAARWTGPRGAYASELDQVCLDIPASRHAAETAFWAELTGWPHRQSTDSAEFSRLIRPDTLPLQLLLQRLDESPDQTADTTAHLDLACDDPPAEIERHVALGARFEYVGRGWHTLTDPVGLRYCITSRAPH